MKFPERVSAAVTQQESEQLAKCAEKSKVTVSQLIRNLIRAFIVYSESQDEQVKN